MKKKFINGFLLVAAFVALATSFVACDDTTEDKFANLHEQMTEQNLTLQDLLNKQIAGLKAELADLEARHKLDSLENNNDINGLNGQVGTLSGQVTTLQQAIDSLKKRIEELENKKDPCDPDGDGNCNCDHSKDGSCNCDPNAGTGGNCTCTPTDCEWVKDSADIIRRINEANKLATEAKGIANAALELAKRDSVRIDADSIRIDELENSVAALEALRYCWSDSLKNAYDKAFEAFNRVVKMEDSVYSEIERLDTLAAQNLRLANAYADAAAQEVQKALEDSVTNLKQLLNDSVVSLNEKIAAIDAAYKAADEKLREDLDLLTKRVNNLETQLDNLTGAFNQLITSVLVQGVTSPVFGYAALPVNLRSNILAAYYGMTDQGTEFPTARPGFYVDQDALKLTSADVKMLGAKTWKKKAGETIVGDEGNAGTLYLTVNPNTVDFTGVQFQLVNSIEEECGVKLSSIAPSDHKLTFGVSRAGNNNGFYEAKATLAVNDINKVKVDLDLEALKDVVVDVKNFRDGFNITNVLSTVVEQLDGVLDANAVKATWTDELGETRSTYSHYAVAATAVKPLSYAFAKDINIQQVPGLDRAENFIDKMADKAYNTLENIIPDFGNISFTLPTINKISIPELDPADCVVKFVIDVNTTVKYELSIDTVISLKDVNVDDLHGATGKVKIPITVPEKIHRVDVEYVDSISGDTIRHTENIHIPAYEFEAEVPSTDFIVDGPTIKLEDFVLSITRELEIPVEYTYEGEQNIYDVVNKLYGNIVGSIEGVNTTIEDLSKFVDDVNAVLDDLNKLKDVTNKVEGVKDEVVAKISKFLDKFNAKFCTLINNANAVLQPVLLAKTNDGFCKLSKAKKMPTVVSNGLFTLMPTSHSAEILAPAAKKLVGVTNVYSLNYKANAQAGDAACLNALQAANAQENIGDVVAGDETKLDIMLQRGFVYEIAYTAVDFSGKVIAQKYYVRVK